MVILAQEDYESLIETLEVLCDKSLVQSIKKAQEDFRKKKGIPWEQAKKLLAHE